MSAAGLRVGLAGAGMISRHHLAAWAALPEARVVALCEPDPQRARNVAREFDVAAVYPHAGAMLDAERLDALDVASPRETQAEIVRLGVGRGLAVLCQKPLCPTLDEARSLCASLPAGARLMVHENWRFRPWYRTASRWLAEDRLGPVRQARLSMLGAGLLPDASGILPGLARQPFFAGERRLLVAEALIHHLDVLRWLLGPLEVIGARVAGNVDAVRGETVATALLETASGAPVVLEGNWTVHGRPARAEDRLFLAGDRASLDLHGAVLQVAGARPAREVFDLDAGYQASFDATIAHFAHCLCDGAPFETGPDDNLHTLALVEAVYAASARASARIV